MSTVHKFGGLSEIIKEKQFVTGLLLNKDFEWQAAGSWSYGNLILEFKVDEKIELTRALVQLRCKDLITSHPLYWTEIKLMIGIRDNTLPIVRKKFNS